MHPLALVAFRAVIPQVIKVGERLFARAGEKMGPAKKAFGKGVLSLFAKLIGIDGVTNDAEIEEKLQEEVDRLNKEGKLIGAATIVDDETSVQVILNGISYPVPPGSVVQVKVPR